MTTNDNSNSVPSWATKYQNFPKAFKIKDGETKTFKFLDNGSEHHDVKNNKEDIVFLIEMDGENFAWYVNAKSPVRRDVQGLGFPLIGKTITLSRKGALRHDTRYSLVANEVV